MAKKIRPIIKEVPNKFNREDFENLFGYYKCNKCGNSFIPPMDRAIKTIRNGMVYEKCKCGGVFVNNEANEMVGNHRKYCRFRPYLTYDESVKYKNCYWSKKNLLTVIENEKKRVENNSVVNETENFVDFVTEEYVNKLPDLLEQRNQELLKYEKAFINNVGNEISSTKVDGFVLTNALSKPFIKCYGNPPKYTSYDLQLANEFFWEKICEFMLLHSKLKIVPTIEQFSSMLGISRSTFTTYYNSNDLLMRETCEIIRDKFIDFYNVRGMTNEINAIMAIFILKARYDLKDCPDSHIVMIEPRILSDIVVNGATKRLGQNANQLVDID